MSRLANLSPRKVVMVYGALPPVEGLAEDDFLSIDRNDDAFTTVQGADGETVRVFNAKDLTTVTFKLLQSSKSNILLWGAHQIDIITEGGGSQTLLVKDLNGLSLFFAPTCWIIKGPEQVWGSTAKEREWKIACTGMPPTNLIGGN